MKISFIWENKILRKILITAFWLLVWQISSMAIGEEILLVSPLNALKKLAELMGTEDYWMAIFTSLYKIFIGLILSVIIGVILSVFSFLSNLFKELIYPVIIFLKSIPVAGFVILLLVWINSSYMSIYIAFFMGMPVIYENVCEGLFSTDKKLREMADSFKITLLKRLKYIYRIKVTPYLRAGITSISGLTFKAGIAAEVIGLQKNSIGEHLHNARIYLNMPDLFAWIITILLLSMILEKGIKIILGRKNA
ncbi:MAG TPA: ABC transporter permease subunit [Mogibacterium sp.]|nr:ABC transporter permease subunit [Mogibacterium sp.]